MLIAAVALAAHWVLWKPPVMQIGVGMGNGADEHLIALVPAAGCGAGMKIYSGHYGDFDAAINLLKTSHVCETVEKRQAIVPAEIRAKRGRP